MGTRLELQQKLVDILGSNHVYYQPPSTIRMEYPAIVYSLKGIYSDYASDMKYFKNRRYSVQYISRTPDDKIVDDILNLPYCSARSPMIVDNLYHYNFELYF